MAETSHAVLRDQLQEERARLQEQLQRLGGGADAHLDFDENFADSGQVTAERGEVEALSVQLAETLTDIDDALAKFDAGTYGNCESCGRRIGEARLEAMPAARLCMDCASQRR
ncbi:MAG TPA: TraR/DksA C4-type zinc finger protein [Acidimicrobiia bacterium]